MAEQAATTATERTSSVSLRIPEPAVISNDVSQRAHHLAGGEVIEMDVLSNTQKPIVEKTALPTTTDAFSTLCFKQWWSFYIDPNLICQDETGRKVHDPRDFLALERTHLAYIRTSNTLALFGVTLAQLFILHDAGSVYGRTLASCAYGLAIVLTISSAVRVLWLQNEIIARRTATATRLFCIIAALIVALTSAVFVINLIM